MVARPLTVVKAEAIAVNPRRLRSSERTTRTPCARGQRISAFGQADDARYRRRIRQEVGDGGQYQRHGVG